MSFEERCYGSLMQMMKTGVKVDRGYIIKYSTQMREQGTGDLYRDRNLDHMMELSNEVMQYAPETIEVHPHAFSALRDLVIEIIEHETPSSVIIDITCLTRIHVLAIAAVMADREIPTKCVGAYTIPENYGSFTRSRIRQGWKDILIAPLADTAVSLHEDNSRGIILLGHDTNRLIVALGEMEPAGGMIVSADTPTRPDFRVACLKNNKHIIEQLTNMSPHGWRSQDVMFTDMRATGEVVNNEIEKAKTNEAPIFLYPFGPKSLSFGVAWGLCRQYKDASWFVYPIPMDYDVDYSYGVADTVWFITDSGERLRR
jgi:hypothetical protein